jgi:hypothetical protein
MQGTILSQTSTAATKSGGVTLALVFLGLLAGIQSADPGISSTALISAGKDLAFGGLDGLAASVSTLALAATVISTGMLADRLGRKKVILVAMLLAIVGDGVVAIAQNPWMFIIGRAIAGIALGAVYGAAFAYIQYFGAKSKGGMDAESNALLTTIRTEANSGLKAGNIEQRRTHFKALSVAMIAFAKKHKGSGTETVAEAWCPMAEGGWLQEGTTLANPYYGAKMLTCGSFK